ncbi:MAG: cadmium-containing carbonic anhydrase [Actinomycetaceae bacterium]|nr:cadmium-containing carbonic anhydrase [Actinomycetaceae bacterium]
MISLSPDAVGLIGGVADFPASFVQAVESGQLNEPVAPMPRLRCMDGRPDADGWVEGVSLAGGPLSVVIASLHLLSQLNINHDMVNVLSRVPTLVRNHGWIPVAHTANSEHGSGCGAADGLRPIIDVIHVASHGIRTIGDSVGVETICDTFELGVFFPDGRATAMFFRTAGAEIEHLEGSHLEKALVINMVPGTRISRAAIAQAGGGDTQVFVLDLWALDPVADIVLETVRELAPEADLHVLQPEACAALATYSLAAAFTLCAPGTPVLVIRNQ